MSFHFQCGIFLIGGSCGLNFSAEGSSRDDRYNSYLNLKQAKILGAKCVPVLPQIRQAHHDALFFRKRKEDFSSEPE